MRSSQENIFHIENNKNILSIAQNIHQKQAFMENGASGSMSQGISQQAIPAELKAFNQHNKTGKQKSDQITVTDTLPKKPKLNSTQLFQSQKKLKLPRCSKCLKKIDYSVLFKCKSCEKTYHTSCTQPNEFCFRCLEKEKKKKIKKEMRLQEKIVKENYTPMNRDDIEIDSDMDQDVKNKMMFLKSFPFYSKGYEVEYPVEDNLFDIYPNVLTPQMKGIRPKYTPLPSYYGSLMEIWNIIKTFPHFFEIEPNFSILQLQTKITTPIMDKKFEQSLLKLLYFHLRDSTWDNLEQFRENEYFPFLSLLRFCSQSGFLDRLFTFTWPKFLACCFDLNLIQIPAQFQYLKAKILKMDQTGQYKLFQQIQQRIDFFTMMARALCETYSFRAMLNDKSEYEKVSSKQKNSWLQGKKSQQAKLAYIKDRLKIIAKQKKKVSKLAKKRELGDDTDFIERLQIEENQLYQQRDHIFQKIKEIDVEIETVNFSFSGFSNIALVGHDKQKNNYWFISEQTDKIIIENGSQWGYYSISDIKALMNSLNYRGVRQNQLYHSLQQYQNLLQNTPQSMIIEDKEQSPVSIIPSQNQNGSIYNQIQHVNMSTIIKLITQAQKKMTKYLLERNARWGNETQRATFIDAVCNQMKQVSEYLQQLRFFNERICVVEIQYKIILEDSAEQIDSRTRKIQTKIWGINEKYKHSWYDYAKICQSMTDLFFLISVLYLNVEKYVSKNRKLRKQYEEVKGPIIYLKTKTGELLQQKWDQYCDNCGGTGQLLCCDICPKVYHLSCIGLVEIPPQEFKCKICVKKRHTRTQLRKNICEQ